MRRSRHIASTKGKARIHGLALGLFLFCSVSSAMALDIKGLAFDSTFDDFNRVFNNTCDLGPKGWDKYKSCTVSTTYAGKPVTLTASSYEGNVLDRILIQFNTVDTKHMIEALTQQYGKPEHRSTVVMQNETGPKVERTVASWAEKGFQISLLPSSDPDKMTILFRSEGATQLEAEAKKKARAEAQKNR